MRWWSATTAGANKELDLIMAFCGHSHIDHVDEGILLPGTYPS